VKGDITDPKALIREAYRIDGITAEQCRSIFLDWALSVPVENDVRDLIKVLMTQYISEPADHPMTVTLQEGLGASVTPRRKGGRAGRRMQ